jgi:hypothetical protein
MFQKYIKDNVCEYSCKWNNRAMYNADYFVWTTFTLVPCIKVLVPLVPCTKNIVKEYIVNIVQRSIVHLCYKDLCNVIV